MSTELKTRSQIAQQYNIHRTTLYRKLREKGIKLPSGLLCSKWQQFIAAALSSYDENTPNQIPKESE